MWTGLQVVSFLMANVLDVKDFSSCVKQNAIRYYQYIIFR